MHDKWLWYMMKYYVSYSIHMEKWNGIIILWQADDIITVSGSIPMYAKCKSYCTRPIFVVQLILIEFAWTWSKAD